MTAKQLIERLKDFPEDMEVCIDGEHSLLDIRDIKLISNYYYSLVLLIAVD